MNEPSSSEAIPPRSVPSLNCKSRPTVECGMRKGAPDFPFVLDLCQREEAMLVTADIEFPRHIKKNQRSHNDCCWQLMLLPADETKQIEASETETGKDQAHPSPNSHFHFDYARHDNLVNLRAHPPTVRRQEH